MTTLNITTFNLSIDLLTPDVRDSIDVARTLRCVANHLAKSTTQERPYARCMDSPIGGTIFAEGSERTIGTWSVDRKTINLTITTEADPRVHCARCRARVHVPNEAQVICTVCASEAVLP